MAGLTRPDLPQPAMISCLEPSPHDPRVVYLAATRYKLDDYEPYLYRTRDGGRRWSRMDKGIARDSFTRVVRADPDRPGLLYVGTETGIWLSPDDGRSWASFQGDLPVAPIHELLVRGEDLIAGTHGRSIWIFGDLTAVRSRAGQAVPDEPVLVAPGPVRRRSDSLDWDWMSDLEGRNYLAGVGLTFEQRRTDDDAIVRTFLDAGENPPDGAVIAYFVPIRSAAPITLVFSTPGGRTIRQFRSRDEAHRPTTPSKPTVPDLKVPASPGWNRFVWDLREEPARRVAGADPASEVVSRAPRVLPGRYRATLQLGGISRTADFDVVADPSSSATPDDLARQHDLGMRIRHLVDRSVAEVNTLRALRGRLSEAETIAVGRPGSRRLVASIGRARRNVLAVESQLQLPDLRPGWADNLNAGVRLLERLDHLAKVVSLGDYPPTDAAEEVFGRYRRQIDGILTKSEKLRSGAIAALDERLQAFGIGPLAVVDAPVRPGGDPAA